MKMSRAKYKLYSLSVLILCNCSGCGVNGINLDVPPVANEHSKTIIEEKDRQHDFGTIVGKPGEQLEWRYELCNETDEPFEIVEERNLKPCCGSITTDKKTFNPGEKGNIIVTMNVTNKYGGVRHTAEIITTCRDDHRVVLKTLVEVAPAIRIEKAETKAKESILDPHNATDVYFTISSKGTLADPPLRLDQIRLAPADKVEWCGTMEELSLHNELVEQQRTFVIHQSEKVPGDYKIEVNFSQNGETIQSYSHSWRVDPPIAIIPKMLVFSKSRTSQKVLLQATDYVPFSILETKTSNESITTRYQEIAKADKHLLAFETKNYQGPKKGFIHLMISHPEQSQVTIPFVFID